MNDSEIERLLRQSPKITPPGHLRERLHDGIALPPSGSTTIPPTPGWLVLFRRWGPAGAIALLTATVIAYQVRSNADLRHENQTLRNTLEGSGVSAAPNAEFERLVAENGDLERLRRDAVELRSLREEVSQLRGQLQAVEALRVENEQLRGRAAAAASEALPGFNEGFFNGAENPRDKAYSISCVNNLKQIGLAARVFATDNEDHYPTSFVQMSNEISNPLILICPADTSKQGVRESLKAEQAALQGTGQSSAPVLFSRLGPSFPSYQLYLSGEVDGLFPMRIIAKCPIHGHVCLADGSVQSDPAGRGYATEQVIDGRLCLVPNDAPAAESAASVMAERYGLPAPAGVNQAAPLQSSPEEPLQPVDPEVQRLLRERYGLQPPAP